MSIIDNLKYAALNTGIYNFVSNDVLYDYKVILESFADYNLISDEKVIIDNYQGSVRIVKFSKINGLTQKAISYLKLSDGENELNLALLKSLDKNTVVIDIGFKLISYINELYDIVNQFNYIYIALSDVSVDSIYLKNFNIDLPNKKQLITIIQKYFKEKNISIKAEIIEQISNFVTGIPITKLKEILSYSIFQFKHNKFDIIIANPPYIKEKEHKEMFSRFKNTKYYQARMDIWYLFMQYSIDLLKTNGVTTYIIPNNWTTNASAVKLRESVFTKTQIMSIVDFNVCEVFKNVAIQTMILTLKRVENSIQNYEYSYLKKTDKLKLKDFLSLSNTNKINFNNKLSYLIFTSHEINNLLNKIVNKSNFKLIRRKEVTQGIVHPQNTVSKNNLIVLKDAKLNEGVFVIDNVKKQELKLNNKEKSIVKPTYKTKDLMKYFKIGKPRFWTIYTDKSFNNIDKISKYPNIKKHLDKYQEIITSDYKPYGLHRTRTEFFFKKGPKILVPRKSIIPTFTYLEDECYPTFTFNVIYSTRIDMKYLTILLNSKLIAFYLKYQGKMQGKHFQIDINPLLNIPIIKNEEKYSILREKLNVLLKEKKVNNKIIDECDSIIYFIYGLNSKEIAIIEKDIEESHGKYFRIKA